VCVPLGSDQEFNARTIGRAGLGLWLRDDTASAEGIRVAVRTVLHEPSFTAKARAFRDGQASRPGFAAAIRRIEALAAARSPAGAAQEA